MQVIKILPTSANGQGRTQGKGVIGFEPRRREFFVQLAKT